MNAQQESEKEEHGQEAEEIVTSALSDIYLRP